MVTHACKGLGFDRVFQLDWMEPRNYGDLTAEKNLLYVSIARASKEFFLIEGNNFTFCSGQLRESSTNHLSFKDLPEVVRNGLYA
jgi:superfamily I DNA/RNA helicase